MHRTKRTAWNPSPGNSNIFKECPMSAKQRQSIPFIRSQATAVLLTEH